MLLLLLDFAEKMSTAVVIVLWGCSAYLYATLWLGSLFITFAFVIDYLWSESDSAVKACHFELIYLLVETFGLLAQTPDHVVCFEVHLLFYFLLLVFEIFGQVEDHFVLEIVYLLGSQSFLDDGSDFLYLPG